MTDELDEVSIGAIVTDNDGRRRRCIAVDVAGVRCDYPDDPRRGQSLTSPATWARWAVGGAVASPATWACPSCGEESELVTAPKDRAHAASCPRRPRPVVLEVRITSQRGCVTCPSCRYTGAGFISARRRTRRRAAASVMETSRGRLSRLVRLGPLPERQHVELAAATDPELATEAGAELVEDLATETVAAVTNARGR